MKRFSNLDTRVCHVEIVIFVPLCVSIYEIINNLIAGLSLVSIV